MWFTNRLFMAYELRLLWRTNPDFYPIWPVFIGVGVVFFFLRTNFRSGASKAKPKKGQFMNFSQGHSGTKVQCESCLFLAIANHPPKRIVYQTVSIYLFFVQSNFLNVQGFCQVPPLNSISPLEVPASVCCQARQSKHLPVVWTCFCVTFCERPWSCCLISDPTGNLFQVCLHWKVRMSRLAPIIMVPNHKPLITLATFFFPTPQIRFFTPSKNKNDGPQKHRKSRGPKRIEFLTLKTLQK